MQEKLKSFVANDLYFNSVLLVLVAFVAFYLGKYSVLPIDYSGENQVNKGLVLQSSQPAIAQASVAEPSEEVVEASIASSSLSFVASKSGTKYHHITCPGAKQIKETNKIYFKDASEAQAAGYSLAANCKIE